MDRSKPTDSAPPTGRKVAIVHDWLYGGGAERVVLELHRLYPEAPIYSSYCSDEWREKLDGKVVTGYLQRWPFNRLRKFLPPLRIRWFESLDLSEYDLVISSSGNGEAKGVRAGSKFRQGQTHVCYCHTPTHFYWRHYEQYLARPGFGAFDPLARLGLRLLVGPLRKWDRQAARRPDYFIANSTHIRSDIRQYYDRDSVVIYPPVDVGRFPEPGRSKSDRKGFVTVGRLAPAKRTDVAVLACSRLNLPLTVIGRGPELEPLRRLAGPSVSFKTDASDKTVAQALSSAEAFLFASHDDFGITPIEAMAAGTPVIAYGAGGVLTVFMLMKSCSLMAVLAAFDASAYDRQTVRRTAERFSVGRFHKEMGDYLDGLPG